LKILKNSKTILKSRFSDAWLRDSQMTLTVVSFVFSLNCKK